MKTRICTLSCLLLTLSLFANTVTVITPENAPGDWDKSTTWAGGLMPESGDIVNVPANKGVTIKGDEYGSPVPLLLIRVWGTLYFEPSGKLDLAAGSEILLLVGGTIIPKNSSSSQLITIDGITKYNAANNGTVTGPAIANSLSGVSTGGQPTSGFNFGTPLTVSFKSFSGEITATGVFLRWETEQEAGVDHFVLERSADAGSHWQEAGRLAAKGAASFYRLPDKLKDGHTALYRIKTIHADQRFDYSSIIQLSKRADKNLFVRFNPSSTSITISCPAALTEKTTVGLVNLSGQVTRKVEAPGIQNGFQLNLQGLASGSYVLYVEQKNMMIARQLIVVQ